MSLEVYLVVGYLAATKKQQDEEGLSGSIVVPLQCILARDEANAIAKAYKLIPAELEGKEDRVEFRVLGFRRGQT